MEKVRQDVYATSGVWDLEKVSSFFSPLSALLVIVQFLPLPGSYLYWGSYGWRLTIGVGAGHSVQIGRAHCSVEEGTYIIA